MRMPHTANKLIKLIALILLAAISVMTAGSKSNVFTKHDKEYYADANTVNFVRPGLVVKIVNGTIANDGTITANVTLADPRGLPLDRDGITTPGAISISCVAAYIPRGQTQYVSYTTRTKTSTFPSTVGKQAIQAATDNPAGTWTRTADGAYTYVFRTKAPTSFDKTATHSIGCQASRNLMTDFELPNNYDTDVFTFVPDGSKVSVTRDVIKTETCNACHVELAFHGGSRRGIEYCVMCHTPQTTNPETDNTVNFPVMIHRIHAGADLPSVVAGKPYQIVGNQNRVSDWSTVEFPANPRNCDACHAQNTGAAQATAYLKPSRAACGACHDDVNFATGENHVNLPQVTDNQCATCHTPQGELEFDASIKGAHTILTRTSSAPGLNFTLIKVDDGVAGKNPTVTFQMKDNAGNPITLDQMRAPHRVALVLAGPTEPDYGNTKFTGPAYTTSGYVSEDPSLATGSGKCDTSGTCTYTFLHGIPADAKGTFTIGIEGRKSVTVLAGTQQQRTTNVGAINKVINFSVDGSAIAPRRQVVAINKCNQCHSFLSLHGENRNQIEMCVLCHNPQETDAARRPIAVNANDRTSPPESISFAYMIHRIHTGEALHEMGAGYTVVGFGGSHNDFSEVRYPVFTLQGGPGDRRVCSMCHVNGSEANLPTGRGAMKNPRGPINPLGTVAAACLGCHASMPTASHALANTTELGESCAACHSSTSQFSVAKSHAR